MQASKSVYIFYYRLFLHPAINELCKATKQRIKTSVFFCPFLIDWDTITKDFTTANRIASLFASVT